MSDEDGELLEGVARGTPDWERIYRAYSKDVYAAAQQALRSTTKVIDSLDVEDVVHETFVMAMRGGVLTPDTRSIVAILRTVAVRRVVDARRRNRKISDEPVEDVAATSGVDPIEEFVEADFKREISQAIWRNQRHLNKRELSIVQAKALGETFAEIGKRMGLTGQRVGQIFKDASKKLATGIDLTGEDGGKGE